MNFCVINLGCKVNRVESDSFARLLSSSDVMNTPVADADIIVVNTCTVTSEAEKKSRKAVHGALRSNDHAIVVVTGCAVAIFPKEFQTMDKRVHVVSKADMEKYLKDFIAEMKKNKADRSDYVFPENKNNSECDNVSSIFQTSKNCNTQRSRVGVKIQDGCNNACTFCIVHVARGKSVSRSADEIIAECVSFACSGVHEIVLTGINLGSYSFDGMGLSQLLALLLDETKNIQTSNGYPMRFRLSSIEPMDIDDELVDLIVSADGRICRHLHLPLQSGSSRILHEMARPYDADSYLELVKKLRRELPTLSLTTDVIVGFPSESESDFSATCDLACACGFSKMHVFPYSARTGSPAACRNDQIPSQIRQRRATYLRDLATQLRNFDFDSRRGTTEFAVVIKNGTAMTESYYEIASPQNVPIGSLVPCTL